MIEIYCPFLNIQREWIPRLRWPDSVTITDRPSVDSTADFKVAWIWADKTYSIAAGVVEDLIRLSHDHDLVFVIDMEIHDPTYWFDQTKNLDNLYWIGSGYHLINRSQWITWHGLLENQSQNYRRWPEQIQSLMNHPGKPRYFDALLGISKPHRDFVSQSVERYALTDKFIMTYYGASRTNLETSQDWIWEPGWEKLDANTIDIAGKIVTYQGHQIMLACIIPTAVYAQTCYSIVTETNYNNHVHMVTEKTAKPMLTKRPFVAFAGRGFLEFLHESGFQTFGSVIDESYDQIEDNTTRWQAAFDQVRWLCEQDQADILTACEPALEHNFRKVWEQDLKIPPLTKIQSLIDSAYERHRACS